MHGIVKNSWSPFLSVHGDSNCESVVSASLARAAATFWSNSSSSASREAGAFGRASSGERVEVEHGRAQRRRAPEGDVRQMTRELAERHRLVVGFPGELCLGHAVEQAAGGRHLVVELREQRIGDSHAPENIKPVSGQI